MKSEIYAGQDVIDSVVVEYRINELQELKADLEMELSAAESVEEFETAQNDINDFLAEEGEELKKLVALKKEVENSIGWSCLGRSCGKTFICEDYFVEYVKETLKDIGYLPQIIPNCIVIDWEATADNIKAEYMDIDFDGTTYYIRA